MKRILIILVLLALIGGGVYAMMRFGIPPFARHHKAAKKAAAPNPPPAQANVPTAEETHEAADITPTRPSQPVSVPTAARKRVATGPPDPETERKLSRLASVYEQMPAEEAGRILVKLPDPFVEKLLVRMDERQVGKLLLTFDADRAARLTQALAR